MSVYGARVCDAAGNIISDYSDNLGKVLGRINVVASSSARVTGSLVDDALLTGGHFVQLELYVASVGRDNQAWVVGNTLYWDFEASDPNFGAGGSFILYGIK